MNRASTRTYSADGQWYTDDGNTWARMTAEDIRRRQTGDQMEDMHRAVRRGSPTELAEAGQAFLRQLIENGTKK